MGTDWGVLILRHIFIVYQLVTNVSSNCLCWGRCRKVKVQELERGEIGIPRNFPIDHQERRHCLDYPIFKVPSSSEIFLVALVPIF